jgi:hypothetical protein
MNKIIFILLLFASFLTQGQDYRVVDWETNVSNVQLLGQDTFSLDVFPLDFNDPSAITLSVGNYFLDYVNRAFKIIASSTGSITVVDLEGKNTAPQLNQTGRIYASVNGQDTLFHSIGGVDLSTTDPASRWRTVARWNEEFARAITGTELRSLPKSTSVFFGGEMTENTSNTINIAAGMAIFVDNYTDPTNSTADTLMWGDTTLTITNIATQLATFITVNSDGEFLQSAAFNTTSEDREKIQLGVAVHENLTSITTVTTFVFWAKDTHLNLTDLVGALGSRLTISGNDISASGANLHIKRTSGETYGVGLNYAIDKKDPNIFTSPDQDTILFFRAYRNGASASIIIPTTEVNTTHYDPNGDGTPVLIPDGFWTAHKTFFSPELNITIVQDGQHIYDSQKKAIDAFAIDSYDNLNEARGITVRTAIITAKDATDLSNVDQSSFVNMGVLGDRDLMQMEGYARFSNPVEIIDGMTTERPSITFLESGGIIYMEIESESGGDMVWAFGQKEYILDCTTNTGTDGKFRIALLSGSDDNPRFQYSYATPLGESGVQITVSESAPVGEFGWLWTGSVQSISGFITDGYPVTSQRNSEAKSHDGRGALSYERERIRVQGTYTNSFIGPVPSFTIVQDTPTDSVKYDRSTGTVYQLHRQSANPVATPTDSLRIFNDPVTPWKKISDISEILEDATGTSLNNRGFNLVFGGVVNSADGQDFSWDWVLLPTGSYLYNSTEAALADEDNTAVTSPPFQAYGVSYLIARVTYRQKNGDWENVTEDILGLNYFDLRGVALGAATGGVGTPVPVPDFNDNTFQVESAGDPTKLWKVNVGNLPTTTTITLDIPTINGTIALVNDLHPALTITGEDYAEWSNEANQVLNFKPVEQAQVVGLVDTLFNHLGRIEQNESDIQTVSTDLSNHGLSATTAIDATTTDAITIGGLTSTGFSKLDEIQFANESNPVGLTTSRPFIYTDNSGDLTILPRTSAAKQVIFPNEVRADNIGGIKMQLNATIDINRPNIYNYNSGDLRIMPRTSTGKAVAFTGGHVLMNTLTDNGSGAVLQVNGDGDYDGTVTQLQGSGLDLQVTVYKDLTGATVDGDFNSLAINGVPVGGGDAYLANIQTFAEINTFSAARLNLDGYLMSDENLVQTLGTSGATVLDTEDGYIGYVSQLSGNLIIIISNLPDGKSGFIRVMQNGSNPYTVNINGTTGYLTERPMGINPNVDPTLDSYSTIRYWRVDTELFYEFLWDGGSSGSSDHSDLNQLDYASAGHTDFVSTNTTQTITGTKSFNAITYFYDKIILGDADPIRFVERSSAPTGQTSVTGDLWMKNDGKIYFTNNAETFDLTATGGSSLWTDGGTTTYLTATGDNVRIGSAVASSYKFQVDGDSYFDGELTVSDASIPIIYLNDTGGDDFSMSGGSDAFAIYNETDGIPIISISGSDNNSIDFTQYGSGNYTGTAAYNLEVTSFGDVIETTAGSDFRMKKNFRTLNGSLDKILSLNTYAFDWIPKEDLPKKAEDVPFNIKVDTDTSKRESAGVIAQEIINVIPESVKQYNNGYYMVDYEAIVPHLIEAIKEQQKQIEDLQKQINELK